MRTSSPSRRVPKIAISNPAVLLAQEIEIEDITWCLDIVDVSGGVPRFQPPLFNREKLTLRVIQRKLPDGPTTHPSYPLALPASQVREHRPRTLSRASFFSSLKHVRVLCELFGGDHAVADA
eukprot:228202-Rhodomonas_salina.1